MDIEFFWNLVEETYKSSKGNLPKQVELLTELLSQRSVDDIGGFRSIMDDLLDNAYEAGLWDACVIINCGCSTDSFSDFRAWLIAHGKNIYEQVLAEPETLVDLVKMDEWADDEFFLYVAEYAYERKTGQELPAQFYRKQHPEVRGTFWPGETRKNRFPKLWAKFGEDTNRWSLLP